MSITEAQRFEMHQGLRNNLGEAVANTLMEHLPPSGWSDVARVKDLEGLETRVNNQIKGVRTTLHVMIGVAVTVALGIFGMLFQISQSISG